MNLTEATSVTINNKTVKKIQLNGQIVYELINIQLTTNKQHIITGETVNINLTSNVINKEVELFKVIGLTKTKIKTLTTDENGQASYTYTGTGAGNVSFVAVYDNKESNTVRIDDYVPVVTTIELGTDKSAIISGQSVLLTATVKDQHGELIPSGTVTFKENGASIGTGTVTSGAATLTVSNFNEGTHSVIAEIGNVTSNTANVNVLGAALTLGITGDSFDSYSNSPFTYTGDVLVDWDDGTIEEYGGGQLTHSYSIMDNRTVKIYGEITGIGQNGFRNSNSIQTVSISSGVTNLGDNCFRDCDITSIILSNSVESIGKNCFAECPNLTSITIPTSVINIGEYCFYDCTDLTEIVLNWSSSSDDIVPYVSSWIDNATSFDHFLIPEGTTALYTAKNYPSNLLREVTSYDDMSLGLSAGSQILSYADEQTTPNSQYATVTAQLLDGQSSATASNVPVVFGAYQNDVLITGSEQTVNTDSNGQASYTYHSAGRGDVVVKAVPDNRTLVSETYELQDYLRYDLATSDKTSSYGACITYRGNGTTTWSYSANNGYRISITNSTEGMTVLSELTGKNNFTVEFDGKMLTSSSGTNYAIGLCAYEDNNNYSRINITNLKTAQRVSIEGTATENESNFDNSININQLIHFKYTIANNQIVEEVTQGTTVIGTRTISYTTTANTKFGICGIWQKSWAENNYFTNIKVKPL